LADQALEYHSDLVGGAGRVGGNAPVLDDLLALEHPQHHVGVAHINRQQHGPPSPRAPARQPTTQQPPRPSNPADTATRRANPQDPPTRGPATPQATATPQPSGLTFVIMEIWPTGGPNLHDHVVGGGGGAAEGGGAVASGADGADGAHGG